MLTLRDLLTHPELGVRLVAGGEWADRPVAGAYAVRAREAVQWPTPGWLVLIDGERLRDRAEQREFILHAAEAGLAAVGVRTGAGYADVPTAMAAEARESGLVLLAIRPKVPFRLILHFVDRRSLLADDVRALAQARDVLRDSLTLVTRLAETHRLLSGPPETGEAAGGRLVSIGGALEGGLRVMAIARPGAPGRALQDDIEDAIAHRGLGCVTTWHEGVLLTLVPETEHAAWAELVSGLPAPVLIGASALVEDSGELRCAVGDAMAALRRLQRCAAPHGGRLSSDEMTLGAWLTGSVRAEDLRSFVRRRFAPLREHPEPAATVARWLVEHRDVQRVAGAMHVHPNTVRYRLGRVEEILSRKLSDVSLLTDLYLAVLTFPEELGVPAEALGSERRRSAR